MISEMVCKFQIKVFLLKIVMFQFQNSFVSTMKSFEEDIIQRWVKYDSNHYKKF